MLAVVAPALPDPAVSEALNRFKGEAVSVGFEVKVMAGSATATLPAQMEAAARSASAIATVAFVSGGDPRALDVWFTDRITGKTVLGHVSVENEAGDRSSTVLAVKAVDFLRARMFDFLVVSRPAAGPSLASPPVSRPTLATQRFTLSGGVGVLRSVQGLGTMVLPLFRGAYQLAAWSSLRLTLAGLGTQARVESSGGSATVAEDLALAEWVLTARPGRRVRPRLVIGAGVHDVRTKGVASPPNTARDPTGLYAGTELSAGLCLSVSQHLALVGEAGAFLLFPEPQVVIARMDAGRTGRPGLSLAITMEASF